ncbi:MAG: hypothetical protein HYT87_11540 [Nitrospirae bacterium]|nr:hypothetical protein [Nitrospirota bacterium]
MTDRLRTYPQSGEMIGLSGGTVRNLVSAGRFPIEPVRIGSRAVRFRESDLARIVSGELKIGPPVKRNQKTSEGAGDAGSRSAVR